MRALVRNKTLIYYADYQEKRPIEDEYGNMTGEYDLLYGNPLAVKANVSAAKGESITRQFGDDVSYDRIILLDDPNFPITESSILWIDTPPVILEDGTTETPHDYIVKRVAPSINSVSIAVSKVNVRA